MRKFWAVVLSTIICLNTSSAASVIHAEGEGTQENTEEILTEAPQTEETPAEETTEETPAETEEAPAADAEAVPAEEAAEEVKPAEEAPAEEAVVEEPAEEEVPAETPAEPEAAADEAVAEVETAEMTETEEVSDEPEWFAEDEIILISADDETAITDDILEEVEELPDLVGEMATVFKLTDASRNKIYEAGGDYDLTWTYTPEFPEEKITIYIYKDGTFCEHEEMIMKNSSRDTKNVVWHWWVHEYESDKSKKYTDGTYELRYKLEYFYQGGWKSWNIPTDDKLVVGSPTPTPTPTPGPDTPPDPIPGMDMVWVHQRGKAFWYEGGFPQGTVNDPKGVKGDGTIRGREIFDPKTKAWYWLDSIYGGAKAEGKEVWMPYVYQGEEYFDDATIKKAAKMSDNYTEGEGQPKAAMSEQIEKAIRSKKGKWVRYDGNGKMLKGWVTITGDLAKVYPNQKGNKYFYDYKTGAMATGYTKIDGQWYYFDEKTGVLK